MFRHKVTYCKACGKKFVSKKDVNAHYNRIHGQLAYKCSYCKQRFISIFDKKVHEQIHTEEKPP